MALQQRHHVQFAAIDLLTTITEGLGRYYLVIFPLAVVVAHLAREHPRLIRPAVCAGILGEVILTALFVSGHPGVV